MAETNFTMPMAEIAPPYTPMVEPPPPDTKIYLMENGEPTSSMSKGEAKKYKSTETADSETDGPCCATPIALATLAGSGVMVAAMIESAGSIKDASADIAAAATAAIAERCAAVIAEYSAKMIALPTTIPMRIANYTNERISKTKDDRDEFGKEYNPVKKTVNDFSINFTSNAEDVLNESKEKANEKIKNDKIDKAKKSAQGYVSKADKIVAKSAETINKIMEHAIEGAEWLQKNIDNEVKRAEKNLKQELETGYKKVENDIDEFSKSEGYKIGVQLIGQYNALIEKQAKKIEDNKKKATSKAKIKADSLIQKAKLQLFAIIGL